MCDLEVIVVSSIFNVIRSAVALVRSCRPLILRSTSRSKFIFSRIKKRRKPKVKIVTLQLCEVKKSRSTFYEKVPTCAASANHRGEKTREGARSGVTRLDRMKHGSAVKDRDDRSSGIEIRIAEALAKINPTDPLILAMHNT